MITPLIHHTNKNDCTIEASTVYVKDFKISLPILTVGRGWAVRRPMYVQRLIEIPIIVCRVYFNRDPTEIMYCISNYER